MNSKMTIGKKQMFAFGAMLAVVLALAWSSLSSIGTLGDIISIANNQTAKKTELAGKFATSAYQMRTGQRGVVMYTLLKNPAMVEKSRDLFQSGAATMRDAIGSIRPMLTKVESRGQVDRIESALSAWQSLYQELVSDCAADKCDGSLSALLDRLAGAGDQIQADAAKLIATQNDIRAEEGNSAASSVSTSRWITVCLILLALVAGGAALAVVWTSTATLRRIAGELSEGAEQTAGAASQVSSSSQSLAQGASEQAASLEETSASTEEINSMAHKNSDNSHAAADSVTSTQQNFMDANRALEQTVAAVGEISAQSGKISKIIKAIDEIAFQTNILALNAAVEAARAGEAGMGFAVVADEVRNLAQRCAQAAKDTSELIEESIAKSNDGKARVDEVASAIRAITGESGKVKTLVDEVHVSSQEQARGIEQIGKAIVQMEQVTQRSAANAEECASAAEELSSQSAAVREIVGRLNALVGGGEKSPAGGAHSSGPRMPVRRAGPTARHTQRPTGLAALAAAISHKTSVPVDPFPNPHTAEDVFPLESEMKRF